MTLRVISVLVVLLVSAACSVSEAALYAVRRTYVRQVLQVGDKLDLQGALAEVVEVDGNRATKTRVTLSDSIME